MTTRSIMLPWVVFASFAAVIMIARPLRAQISDDPGPWGPMSLAPNESLVKVATDYVSTNSDNPAHTAGLAYCDQQGLDMGACSHLGDRAEYCTYGSFSRGYMIATPNPDRRHCPVPGQNGMYSVSSPDKALCLIYLRCADGGWYASAWSTAPYRCEVHCPTGQTANEVQVVTWITNQL